MKLEKRLYINNEEVKLAKHMVSLKLSLGGVAIFTINTEMVLEKHQAVRFDIGYNNKIEPWFEGFIEKIQPAENGHQKITVKENSAILNFRLGLSLEHPSMREVINEIEVQTGLDFTLPEADYIDKVIPNFMSSGNGYQCLKAIGRAFGIPDLVWYQHTDQTVFIGAYQDCRFFNKPVKVPQDLSLRHNGDNVTFAPFPMLRPGAIINEKRISRLDLIGDEMTAYWQESTQSAKKREWLQQFPEFASGYHLPLFGQIVAVRDESTAGQMNDAYRPRFAVDVQLLDENLNSDKRVPVYRSIPMPINIAGNEAGAMTYPTEGTLVEIAFAYGRNDHPIIRNVYGKDYALPELEVGEQLQQQRYEVNTRVNAAGETKEQTDQIQTKEAFHQIDKADRYQGEFGSHHITVDEHSIEEIVGQKVIEALGAISLLAGDNVTLGSLGNMQLATAGELITTIGKLRNTVIILDDKYKVLENRIQEIGKDDIVVINGQQTITISKDQIIQAKNISMEGGKIKLNGGAGVITCESICPFTGKPHVDGSTTVFAGK
ncbi:hypothetical protein ACTFQF_16040 [Aliivibrio fischeri]|uniref:hypothetical protein n=1 Tax=Aliivibrio fischeri TaxID=668 RepID=UPI0007C4B8AA|nr:hypothetical protein [Aliivibrio fischeri]MBP3140146.1 hypothetical protein [Aliivibrio fischeri]MBP3154528.1 hypothetical protein [Aliivibrio fischeri]MCE7572270.1 hypothetical protein [Aliivibrio fischeri]